MSRRDPFTLATVATMGVGFLLLVVFNAWYTRTIGVLALLAAIVLGVIAIADPAFLEDEDA